jgi:hypothetical protein
VVITGIVNATTSTSFHNTPNLHNYTTTSPHHHSTHNKQQNAGLNNINPLQLLPVRNHLKKDDQLNGFKLNYFSPLMKLPAPSDSVSPVIMPDSPNNTARCRVSTPHPDYLCRLTITVLHNLSIADINSMHSLSTLSLHFPLNYDLREHWKLAAWARLPAEQNTRVSGSL